MNHDIDEIPVACCYECVAAEVNGDLPTVDEYNDAARVSEVLDGLQRLQDDGYRFDVLVNDEGEISHSFSWSPCDICDTPLGGERIAGILYSVAR